MHCYNNTQLVRNQMYEKATTTTQHNNEMRMGTHFYSILIKCLFLPYNRVMVLVSLRYG